MMATELWGPGLHSKGLEVIQGSVLCGPLSTKKRPSSPSTDHPPDLRLSASLPSPLNHLSAAGLERNAPEP